MSDLTTRYTKWRADQVSEMYEYYTKGHSLKETAKEYDMSLENMRQIFLRRGLAIRPAHKTIKDRRFEYIEELERIIYATVRLVDIMREGLSEETYWRIHEKYDPDSEAS